MAIGQAAPEFESVERAVRETGNCATHARADRCWARGLAAGTLVAGAILIARGRRRKGLLSAAAALVLVLLEHPDEVSAVWNKVPVFIENSKHMLNRAEDMVGELSRQVDKVQGYLEKATAKARA